MMNNHLVQSKKLFSGPHSASNMLLRLRFQKRDSISFVKLTSFSNDPLYKTPITAPVITILVPTFSSIGFIGKKNWFQVLTCKLLYYTYILGHCKGVANLFCNINIYREVLTHFPIF